MIYLFLFFISILLFWFYYREFFLLKYLLFKKINIPNHIAIIMDGNRRWAKKRKLPSFVGHSFGAKNIHNIIEGGLFLNIKYLSFYTLSIENLKRSEEELNHIFKILEKYISDKEIYDYLQKNKISLKIVGNLSLLNKDLRAKLEHFVHSSFIEDPKLTLQFAICYSGREEIIKAINNIIKDKIESINQEDFANYLYTQNIPDPDLLIRTSGENRISNFFLWQIAYTEFYFSKKMWPEFDKYEFYKSILNYGRRNRNYGK